MRTGGNVIAALLVVSVACGSPCAFAGEIADGTHPDRFLLFSGFNIWRVGGFAHGGMLWSPNGIGREGFTFKALIAGGRYQYRSGASEIEGRQSLATAMPGWRFVQGRTQLTLFAGIDLQSNRFRPDDPTNAVRGKHAGLRVGADFWSEPVAGMMVAASVSASTIGPSIWSRVAAGARLFNSVWFGPELGVMGDSRYQQFRAGAHITSLKTGRFEWSFGFGYALDSDHRSGPYARIGLLTRD